MASNKETPLSRRLDEAAKRSGLTNEQISERLGMTAANINHWRKGRHRPDVEQIQKFAQAVGASDYYLLTGRQDPADLVRAYQVARQRWQQAVAGGQDAAEAWETILGQEGLFTLEEREQFSGETGALARFLVSVDGVEWIGLTGEQHRLVQDLVRLFARTAPPEDEPTGWG